jgi:hypothetical protein
VGQERRAVGQERREVAVGPALEPEEVQAVAPEAVLVEVGAEQLVEQLAEVRREERLVAVAVRRR